MSIFIVLTVMRMGAAMLGGAGSSRTDRFVVGWWPRLRAEEAGLLRHTRIKQVRLR
jgi:hypothetical protein